MTAVGPVPGHPHDDLEDGVVLYEVKWQTNPHPGLPAGHIIATDAAAAVRTWIAGTPASASLAAVVVDFTHPAGPLTTVTGYGPQGDA